MICMLEYVLLCIQDLCVPLIAATTVVFILARGVMVYTGILPNMASMLDVIAVGLLCS